MRQAGITKAGDFGGTWYWNRYPGAQCDVESYMYLPLLEETGYIPKERYAFAPEIFAHAQRIGKHFNLYYEKACFQTQIKEARWDDHDGWWTVTTDRGDVFKARFVVMSNGPLNRPNVMLVDTNGKGVDRVTEHGVVVDGVEYEVDCLIFATGFEVGTAYTRRAEFEVYGRGGVALSDAWAEGMRTYHGFLSHGFPNCFHMELTQTGFAANFTYMLDEQSTHVAHLIAQVRARKAQSVEPTAEAEAEWVKQVTTPTVMTTRTPVRRVTTTERGQTKGRASSRPTTPIGRCLFSPCSLAGVNRRSLPVSSWSRLRRID